MKRIGGLWERVIGFDNLLLAFRKARRGKRRRPPVACLELNLEAELLALQRELQSGEYAPGAYRLFTIYERKPRLIAAAPFRDRVVHHALLNVIEPPIDRRFISTPTPAAPARASTRRLCAIKAGRGVIPMPSRWTSPAISPPSTTACSRKNCAAASRTGRFSHCWTESSTSARLRRTTHRSSIFQATICSRRWSAASASLSATGAALLERRFGPSGRLRRGRLPSVSGGYARALGSYETPSRPPYHCWNRATGASIPPRRCAGPSVPR